MTDLAYKFKNVAITYNNMVLFKTEDAIELVRECLKANKSVYGIDAFILNEPNIEPYMEYSINANEAFTNHEQAEVYVMHLSKYLGTELVFEVVYEGY